MGGMGVLGLALLFGGIIAGRAFTANFELDAAGKVRKGLGVAAAVVGALLLLRGLGLVGAPVHSGSGKVEWRTDLAAAEAEAKSTGRPLMVDFSADWCKACKELEAHTFSADEVAPELSKWVTVRVDMTQDKPEHAAMRTRFGIQGLPTVAFIDAQGQWLTPLTLTGFEPPAAFLERLEAAESGAVGEAGASLADRIKASLADDSLVVYLLVFLAGIVASLSPCVYPLIPITLSLFGARGASSRLRGFTLSLVYVLGIAVTYSALGVLAATTGGLFGSALQSGWVVGAIALVFFAMGLSMVGVFELQLPESVNERLNQLGGGEGGRFLTAFVMGTVAGVIAAPCVGPPLVAVLAFVAQKGSVATGVSLLSVYSLGMGLLFIVLGTFTQFLARMPKSGGWMEVVKGTLGMVMLVVALVYANDVVPFLP